MEDQNTPEVKMQFLMKDIKIYCKENHKKTSSLGENGQSQNNNHKSQSSNKKSKIRELKFYLNNQA